MQHRPADSLPDKHLLKQCDIDDALIIHGRRLQYSATHLHRMRIVERTWRYPRAYIAALLGSQALDAAATTIEATRAFSHTEAARTAILQGEAEFKTILATANPADDPVHPIVSRDVARLFCVSRMAVTDWKNAGIIDSLPKAGRLDPLYIPAYAVENAYRWEYPELYAAGDQ